MIQALEKTKEFIRDFAARLAMRNERSPIASIEMLNEFIATRAAFITQKTHYGYIKTRMGTQYPKMFQDDAFISSINIANMHIFAACLSDLTIHGVAKALGKSDVQVEKLNRIAMECYRNGLAGNPGSAGVMFNAPEAEAVFAQRLDGTDWGFGASLPENFTRSPKALVKWAPIAPELKRYDVEIVENSIKFAWQEVRAQLERRLDAEAIERQVMAED